MKSLLCDAVIIIDVHRLELWKALKSNHKICIASAVLKESRFFKDDLQTTHYLDFKAEIEEARIMKISMKIEDIQAILRRSSEHKIDIHTGEAESLAALLKPDYQDLYFCTADKAAVAAAHLYDVAARILSLEKCLDAPGSGNLPYKLTEKAMQTWKAWAIQRIC